MNLLLVHLLPVCPVGSPARDPAGDPDGTSARSPAGIPDGSPVGCRFCIVAVGFVVSFDLYIM